MTLQVVRAPGRVNLIGEHIDYCGLPVFPMALQHSVRMTFHPRGDREVRLVNRDAHFAPSAFTMNVSIAPAPAGDWSNYARAAAQALVQRFPPAGLRGVDALVESDLPIAAGLSSSSALVVATALALLHANGLSVPPLELMELLGRGERYVGTAGGGMDQAIILGARTGCASRIDFHPLRLTPTAVPTDWRFLVASSLVHAEKSGAARQAYNERPRQCDEARRLVATRLGRPADTTYPAILAAAPVEQLLEVAEVNLSDVLSRRFRHVVTEGTRVRQAEAAMGAADLAAFGRLLDASHQSLRDDYEVSHPELDQLVELARDAGAAGARLTGAGFGGSIVALATVAGAPQIIAALRERFYAPRGAAGDIVRHVFIAEPSAGAAVRTETPNPGS